jgi:parallel beta-helix repeat protein
MMKKALSAIILIGILLVALACLGGAATEQAAIPTEIPSTATPTDEPGIHLSASNVNYPLEKAIEQAKPGETIHLEAGTYSVITPLLIDKPLTLIGAGHESTIITSYATGSVIHYTGEGLFTLEGIAVQHKGDQPASAVLVENGEINFSNCRLTGATIIDNGNLAAGLFALGNATGSVKNCIVDNNLAAGIFLAGNSSFSLEDNICQGNDGFGIVFRENAGGLALNNKCNNNVVAGFFLLSDGEIQLKNNECSHNGAEEDSSGGIIVRGTTKPILDGNTCTDNPAIGIVFREEAGGKAINNDFSRNGLEGIFLEGKAAPEIQSNICSQNGLAGIFIVGEATPNLKGNTCNQNGTASKGAGIAYFDQTGGVASENTVSNNRDGIFISAAAAPELVENMCSENVEYGIYYANQSGGSAIKNQCTGNGKAGIAAAENSTPLLQENICFGNQVGIYIAETANPELVNNDLYENTQDDLVDLRP